MRTQLQVTEKKLSKLDMAYQSYLEQQARLEDPVRRLEVCVVCVYAYMYIHVVLSKLCMHILRNLIN